MAAATAPLVEAEVTPPGASTPPEQGQVLPHEKVPARCFAVPVESHLLQPETVNEVPEGRPRELLFGALINPLLRMRRAIPLEVATEQAGVVVSWREIEEFGYGETMSVAVEDFSHTLVELYFRLNDPTARLSPDLENVKRVLASYIEVRPRV
jgi:hypothetical protein